MSTRTIVLEVQAERERQDRKWGAENIVNRGAEWGLAVLMEEVGEVAEAILEDRAERAGVRATEVALGLRNAADKKLVTTNWTWQARKELIQVAAVAVAMVEAIDKSIEDSR